MTRDRTLVLTLLFALAACELDAYDPEAGPIAAPADHVVIGDSSYLLGGVDVPREANDLIVYTRGSAPTNEWGCEVAVVDGVVTRRELYVGGMAVPSGGVVLSGHGAARVWLTEHAPVGARIDRIPGVLEDEGGAGEPPPSTGPTFRAAITALPGLRHYYPLDATSGARDTIGTVHGSVTGVAFGAGGATFGGDDYIELPDHDDFSATTTGRLTIVAFLRVDDWRANRQGGEYVHWMGKGVAGAHEWTFRYYPDNHASRPRRVSFYHFNPAGGLGAGSYFQDATATGTEFMVVGSVDPTTTRIFRDGELRDTDALSGYDITPRNTTTPVRIGTRDRSTGFLVGRLRRVAFFSGALGEAQLATLWDARARAER